MPAVSKGPCTVLIERVLGRVEGPRVSITAEPGGPVEGRWRGCGMYVTGMTSEGPDRRPSAWPPMCSRPNPKGGGWEGRLSLSLLSAGVCASPPCAEQTQGTGVSTATREVDPSDPFTQLDTRRRSSSPQRPWAPSLVITNSLGGRGLHSTNRDRHTQNLS